MQILESHPNLESVADLKFGICKYPVMCWKSLPQPIPNDVNVPPFSAQNAWPGSMQIVGSAEVMYSGLSTRVLVVSIRNAYLLPFTSNAAGP